MLRCTKTYRQFFYYKTESIFIKLPYWATLKRYLLYTWLSGIPSESLNRMQWFGSNHELLNRIYKDEWRTEKMNSSKQLLPPYLAMILLQALTLTFTLPNLIPSMLIFTILLTCLRDVSPSLLNKNC